MEGCVPSTLSELFERFEFLSARKDGSEGEQGGKNDLKSDLYEKCHTSTGRKKGSWLT